MQIRKKYVNIKDGTRNLRLNSKIWMKTRPMINSSLRIQGSVFWG